ncbi:MAG: peptidylprolyl isomerase [Salinivirgaceae bacterium]|nr:peptidylprolyl isomerase [Salinivirgaceae bacterium]
MKRIVINSILITISAILLSGCGKLKFMSANNNNEQLVLIETEYGNIKVRLYNETPLHSANFAKLADEGFYNDLLFHRVINKFMIQGGDPGSKNAPADKMLGAGEHGEMIPAEFNNNLIHKKGALAAARNNNPEKKSSGCQFYIVQGEKQTDAALDQFEARRNMAIRQNALNEYMQDAANMDTINLIHKLYAEKKMNELNDLCEKVVAERLQKQGTELFKYTDEQREIYKTIGGTPFLDGDYTVYGEVVEGLEVVDSIAAVKTGRSDRPVKDVAMKMKLVKK